MINTRYHYSLADFLPPEYVEEKEIDKKIFQEHRKLQGMTELNAKFRFVQLCRSLKTYGVTFFLVKVLSHFFFCYQFLFDVVMNFVAHQPFMNNRKKSLRRTRWSRSFWV